LDNIVLKLNNCYGNEIPITVHRRSVHDYMRMTLDYSAPGKVPFSMRNHVEDVLDKAFEFGVRTMVSAAANYLFNVRRDAEKLGKDEAKRFHHLKAKLLYLSKRVGPDIQTEVAFLFTRVKLSDCDNWHEFEQ